VNAENRCPACDAELAANAPRGLCPDCLLKQGLQTTPLPSGGQANADFVPPTPAGLAPCFPDLEILELVGRGGMGMVYKARQKRLDRFVALKILSPKIGQDPAFAERFAREARAMAMLNHPHIVAVYDFGQTTSPLPSSLRSVPGEGQDGSSLPSPSGRGTHERVPGGEGGLYYFLMEFVDGLNLRRLLDTGKLAPEEALAIVPQICDALQYAHDHGVVHRDIKPENVLLDKEGRVKIADFGIAKLVGREAQGTALTGAGQIVGTPQYMAPEQIEHPLQVDHRADIYSLGVVFYQMLTGELPIGRFAPPSKRVQIDVRLDEVVLRALEKEPEQRYQQASQLKTRVETIAQTRPRDATPSPFPTGASGEIGPEAAAGPWPRPRFSRLAIAGAVCAPFFLGVLAWLLATLRPAPGPEPLPAPPLQQVLNAIGMLLVVVICASGFAAPFGTTILGLVSLRQIRRSAGRLYGLGLALFDAMLYPLLVLDWFIAVFCIEVTMVLRQAGGHYGGGEPDWPLVTVLTVPIAAAVDFFLVRAAWRAVRGSVNDAQKQQDRSHSAPAHAEIAQQTNAVNHHATIAYVGLTLAMVSFFVLIATLSIGDSVHWFNPEVVGFGAFAIAILALILGAIARKTLPGKITLGFGGAPLCFFLVLLLWTGSGRIPAPPKPEDAKPEIRAPATGSRVGDGSESDEGISKVHAEKQEFVGSAPRTTDSGSPAAELKALQGQQAIATQGKPAPPAGASEQYGAVSNPVGAEVQKTASSGAEAGTAVFGPVIERLLESAVSGKSAIDLDTGKLYTGPQVVKEFKELDHWMKATGVDALGMTGPAVRGLGGFDMVALAVENDRWNLSVAELKATLATGKPGTPQMIGKGGLPATYLFKTREGGMGVLQIVGFSDKPRGVSIRYKLVRKPVPAAAVAMFDSGKAQRVQIVQSLANARDEQTLQRVQSEMKANSKEFEALLQGTVAEIPMFEQHERLEAYNRALREKDKQEMERLRKEMESAAAAFERLIHGTEGRSPILREDTQGKPGQQADARGPVLIYEVDPASAPAGMSASDFDKLLKAIDRRLNSGPEKLARPRKLDDGRIEVAMLRNNDADRQRVQRLLARSGTLEFRILASNRQDKAVIEQARRDPSKAEVLDSSGKRLAWWVPVKAGEENSFAADPVVARRSKKQDHRDITEILVVTDSCNVTGTCLTKAEASADNSGPPCINFTFNDAGGKLFAKLTGGHLPDASTNFRYRLGIILDGELDSAPCIMSTISERGAITGSFSKEDIADLVDILNAGSLPVRIRLVRRSNPAAALDHLKQIAVAMYYYDTNHHFPPAVLYAPDGKERSTMESITDGPSCTILLVEAKRNIPWTKPADIPYDPHKLLPALGGYSEGGFHEEGELSSVPSCPL